MGSPTPQSPSLKKPKSSQKRSISCFWSSFKSGQFALDLGNSTSSSARLVAGRLQLQWPSLCQPISTLPLPDLLWSSGLAVSRTVIHLPEFGPDFVRSKCSTRCLLRETVYCCCVGSRPHHRSPRLPARGQNLQSSCGGLKLMGLSQGEYQSAREV